MTQSGAPLTSYPGWSNDIVDKDTVKSWRVGSQLVYALLTESQHPGHKDGVPVFLDLMNNLNQLNLEHDNDNDEFITLKDSNRMFDIIVKENKSNLLSKILNNPLIPNSSINQSFAKRSLKKAIRLGSYDILNYMIEQNVTILSTDMNTFDDLKSIIFNILGGVQIAKHSDKSIAKKFWNYLAKCLYQLYHHNAYDNSDDIKTCLGLPDWSTDIINKYDDNSDKLTIRKHLKYFISNPLIIYAIYKKIDASMSGRNYIFKIYPMLQFICENYMIFDDKISLNNLFIECNNDKIFDCSQLIKFNINYGNLLLQQPKSRRNCKLFWSEYIIVTLINNYFGIDPKRINTVKKMNQYGHINVNKNNINERKMILKIIKHLTAYGCAKYSNNIIMPLINDYANKFGRNNNDKKEINNIINACEYGKNIWILKTLPKNEMLLLFSKCQINIPYNLISCILSFVVL